MISSKWGPKFTRLGEEERSISIESERGSARGEAEVPVQRGEHRLRAAVVAGLAGHAVAAQGHSQAMDRVEEDERRLAAAVARSPARRVATEAIGRRPVAVVERV